MAIRIDRVNKSFSDVPVLKDIQLEFADLEFVTLVGPSGCGKTTLLRILAGLESATRGEIFHDGKLVSHLAPGKRDIAMVFQNYALYPHMDVFHNIGYGLKVRGVPKEELRARVVEVARVLELEAYLHRRPRELSGGQRQRVALGRAMVRKPWLFLMDEPLSNLDAKLRVTMRSELKRFHLALRTTTVYVTHDQLEAMTMSDRIAVMDRGVIQQFGPPQEIYNRPANLFVAGFIGSPPMNFITGVRAQDGRLVHSDAHALPVRSLERFGAAAHGRDLVLGVRPQDVRVTPAPGDGALTGAIELVQLVGSEKLLDVVLPGGLRITAEVRADLPVGVGQSIGVEFDEQRIHLFDAATQRSVLAA
ncbi:MAG: ABC transporter ATP-binding protein [Betaproteobacteria bacterium]